MYGDSFYLTENCGNNAFSYDRRISPRLFVPAVKEGGFDNVVIGEEIGFEDFNEKGELKSCRGLKNLVRTDILGTPAVIMDNHNHAFYFWWEAKEKGLIDAGATLVHVDQHKDTREPEKWYAGVNLEDVFEYTNKVLNVGNYIPPARCCGLLEEIIFITGNAGLDEKIHKKNVILNLDLDFFVPEMEIDFEKARKFIQKQAKEADFITVATSPFFMDQKEAITMLKRLF